MKVKISAEQQDEILVKSLNNLIENFEESLIDYDLGKTPYIFDMDKSADIKRINKHIKAAKLIVSYFTPFHYPNM